MMCIGSEFVLVGLHSIANQEERNRVHAHLQGSGREIVELTADQVANFAGNAIELRNATGQKLLVLSTRALSSLRQDQLKSLSRYVQPVPLSIPTIELGGGSARCMLATVHLPRL